MKFTDLFFVNRCALCRKPSENALCDDCQRHITYLNYGCCERCGKPFRDCICKNRKPKFKRCVVAFNYGDSAVKALIYKLKERGNRKVVSFITDAMANRIKSEYRDIKFDFITFVPMASAKHAYKGFDHAELIAQRLSEILEIPLIDPPFKRRSIISQKYLTFSERSKTAYTNYLPKNKRVSGRALLVDDIITTGFSLSGCSLILKNLGAKEVFAAAAASSPK